MTRNELRSIFESAGVGYVFADNSEEADSVLRRDIAEAEAEYIRRYGQAPHLLERIRTDEAGLRAFVQALATPMSALMRVMVLRLIEGASVASLEFRYRERAESHLVISIRSPAGEEDTFISDDLFDADVIRHMAMYKVSTGSPGAPGPQQPVLDGYYAFTPVHTHSETA